MTVPRRLLTLGLAGALLVAGAIAYSQLRPRIFAAFAAGTQWVLVTCGFVDRDDAFVADERWRKLYYAVRMFEGAPPAQWSPEDAAADRRYPGMGFGVLRTFDRRPVTLAIGGWLYAIPCTYFSDARDCQATGAGIARLRVSVPGLAPIASETVADFLSATSPATLRITIAGRGARAPYWWQVDDRDLPSLPDPPPGFRRQALESTRGYDLVTPLANADAQQLQCTDPAWARRTGVFDHCLLRFQYSDDVYVELKFATALRAQWQPLRDGTRALVEGFQVRRAPATPAATTAPVQGAASRSR